MGRFVALSTIPTRNARVFHYVRRSWIHIWLVRSDRESPRSYAMLRVQEYKYKLIDWRISDIGGGMCSLCRLAVYDLERRRSRDRVDWRCDAPDRCAPILKDDYTHRRWVKSRPRVFGPNAYEAVTEHDG